MAATPGPWILDDDSWSDGDNANVSTEERYDGHFISIAQIEGGGSESGLDEPFSAEQQANARYITAANPDVVIALLAELEAKDKTLELEREKSRRVMSENHQQAERIAELEVYNAKLRDWNAGLAQESCELQAKLATPVRLLGQMLVHDWEHRVDRQAAFEHRKTAWDARLEEDKKAIRAAGFTFIVEGDE
ncbi:hypothetical protein EGO53_02630 [Serratia liquefaciens]|uniref:Ead/Ea22-like family protein n=2 Tax=Serratia liquefaciens TaxID=614 RepID=A0A515D4K7_SERLI|nr:hypothetical protein EGO53_02630 [Serratia liquefaciens]